MTKTDVWKITKTIQTKELYAGKSIKDYLDHQDPNLQAYARAPVLTINGAIIMIIMIIINIIITFIIIITSILESLIIINQSYEVQ